MKRPSQISSTHSNKSPKAKLNKNSREIGQERWSAEVGGRSVVMEHKRRGLREMEMRGRERGGGTAAVVQERSTEVGARW